MARAVIGVSFLMLAAAASCASGETDDTAGGSGAGGSSGSGGSGGSGASGGDLGDSGGFPEAGSDASAGAAGSGAAGTGGVGGAAGAGGAGGVAGGAAGGGGAAGSPPNCPATWKRPFAAGSAAEVVTAGDVAFVVGTESDTAWLAGVSSCDGSVIGQTTNVAPASATSSAGTALHVAGANLFVVGGFASASDPGNGFYSRFSTTGALVAGFRTSLFGSADVDRLSSVAVTQSGVVWMSGQSGVGGTQPRAWGVVGESAASQACGFPLSPASSNVGNADVLAAVGSDVWVATKDGPSLVLQRWDQAACATTGPCSCTPAWTSPSVDVGVADTDARDLLLVGSDAYIAGLANDGDGDAFGYVVRVSTSTGGVLGTYRWNPTSQTDAFLGLASDGSQLYAAGGRGWDGQPGFNSATSSLHALPLGFANDPIPAFTRNPASLNLIASIAVVTTPSPGLLLFGLAGGSAVLQRCETNGTCPN